MGSEKRSKYRKTYARRETQQEKKEGVRGNDKKHVRKIRKEGDRVTKIRNRVRK